MPHEFHPTNYLIAEKVKDSFLSKKRSDKINDAYVKLIQCVLEEESNRIIEEMKSYVDFVLTKEKIYAIMVETQKLRHK